MKQKTKQIIRWIFQTFVGLFILYLGINIIARGTTILCGKTLSEVAKDTADSVTEQIGIFFMKKTGGIFSYLYNEKDTENLASKIYKKTYLLMENTPEKIIYPDEDNLYEDLFEDFLAKKKYEEDEEQENTIPVITIIPDYYDDERGEGDIDDEPAKEAVSSVVRPLAPPKIFWFMNTLRTISPKATSFCK